MKAKFTQAADGVETVTWFCPGCGVEHSKTIAGMFNLTEPTTCTRDTEAPTLLGTQRFVSGGLNCHSIISAGSIRFLPTSQHALKGLTRSMVVRTAAASLAVP